MKSRHATNVTLKGYVFITLAVAALLIIFCGDSGTPNYCGDGHPLNTYTEFCYEGQTYPKCNGGEYDPTLQFCRYNELHDLCGNYDYDPAIYFCSDNNIFQKCAGQAFDPTAKFCRYNELYDLCGRFEYDPAINFCWDSTGNIFQKCAGQEFDPDNEGCIDNVMVLTKCGKNFYDKTIEFCYNNTHVFEKCEDPNFNYDEFDPQYGCDGVSQLPTCGDAEYEPSTHFCYYNESEGKYETTEFCGDNVVFDANNFECVNGDLQSKNDCDGIDPETHFCDTRDNKAYRFVVIGHQTWMAENLSFNAAGSRCNGTIANNCNGYGRHYDWATAMAISSSYNSALWSGGAGIHRGICPDGGWRLPSDEDWSILENAVGGRDSAAKHLKAQTGWNDCGPLGSGHSFLCEDTFGFSALPGGSCYMDNCGGNAGDIGFWWSATESGGGHAINRYMRNNVDSYDSGEYGKINGYSVRCVKD